MDFEFDAGDVPPPPVELRPGVIKAITLGSFNKLSSTGFWSAELLWLDDSDEPMFCALGTKATVGDNVSLDVLAALAAIRQAVEIGLPIEIHSANESVVRTVPEYMVAWKLNNWKKKGKIASKAEWQEIDRLCQIHSVIWCKRHRDHRDGLKDFEEVVAYQEHQRNMLWATRAEQRDRS